MIDFIVFDSIALRKYLELENGLQVSIYIDLIGIIN